MGSGSPCKSEVVVVTEVCLESRIGFRPGSPCESELVVFESELWLESWVGVEHMCPHELEVVVESESWLESSVLIGPCSPLEPEVVVDTGAWLESSCGLA